MAPDLETMVHKGLLEIIYLWPLDLLVDEALLETQAAVERPSPTPGHRLPVWVQAGIAPDFRVDFRESLYRIVSALTTTGVTGVMTVEVAKSFTDPRFSTDLISFLSDDVIFNATSKSNVRRAK